MTQKPKITLTDPPSKDDEEELEEVGNRAERTNEAPEPESEKQYLCGMVVLMDKKGDVEWKPIGVEDDSPVEALPNVMQAALMAHAVHQLAKAQHEAQISNQLFAKELNHQLGSFLHALQQMRGPGIPN